MEYIGNILFDKKLLEHKGNIIIYGAGKYGRRILEFIELNKKELKVCGFCDLNNDKVQQIEKFPIYKPKEGFQKYTDALYLIGGKYCADMYRDLKNSGINNVHILFL